VKPPSALSLFFFSSLLLAGAEDEAISGFFSSSSPRKASSALLLSPLDEGEVKLERKMAISFPLPFVGRENRAFLFFSKKT